MATGAASSAARRPAARSRRSGARPTPTRVPELAHVTLLELRAYRDELTAEESRVSYWRRLMQARLDVVRLDNDHEVSARLREVLADAGARSRRSALLAVLPADDVPPLPDLAQLWEAQPVDGNERARLALVERLEEAERTLSTYRQALHERLDQATAELIARYAEDPQQALVALPLEPERDR